MAGSWGGSSWGGLSVTTSFDRAVAYGPKLVDVFLTGVPLAASVFGSGDALNPNSWTVVRSDTGAVFTVVAATKVSDLRYRLQVVEPLGPPHVTHVVSSSTLRSALGTLLVPPKSAEFAGPLPALTPSQEVAQRPIDVRSRGASPGFAIGGGLVMGSDGDYTNHAGAELFRKLILRRITTLPGEFFYLPNYGTDLELKMPMTPARLIRMKGQLESTIPLEPEVVSASVSLQAQANGTLFIGVEAQLKIGGSFWVRYAVSPNGVQVA